MKHINVKSETGFIAANGYQNLAFIDALRGVAILMVIITHVNPVTQGVSSLLSSFCSYGRMGVQLFFVLSAFTLCLTYAGRANDPNAISKFYIRRYLRIAPMYYVGILFYTGLVIMEQGVGNIGYVNIAWHLALLHGLNMSAFNNVVPGGWSIGVEFIFYLIFPLIFKWVNGSLKGIFIVLAVTILVALSLYLYLMYALEINVHAYSLGYWNFVNQLPVFIVGFLLYFHFDNFKRNINPILFGAIFAFATAISMLLYLIKPIASTVFIPVASAISFYALAMLFYQYDFLALKVLQLIGKVSFSMYLIHFVVIDIVVALPINMFVPNVQLLFNYLVVTVITYCLACVTYRFIESRGVVLAKTLTRKF